MTSRVQDYYDRNTRGFLRFGQGRETGAIHRAVWGPGVSDRNAAFRFVEDRIFEVSGPAATLVDLGCGVGASLAYLASRSARLEGLGVTLSPVQADLACTRFERAGLDQRWRVVVADFTKTAAVGGAADVVFAIESFLHGVDPSAFFEEASRLVRPGGAVVVCDDFLSAAAAKRGSSDKSSRMLADFRRGWRVGTLITTAQAEVHAAPHGLTLERDEDWTPWLELGRPRDIAIRAVVKLGRHLPIDHPFWSNLVGGDALQRCIQQGLVNYRFTVWRRGPSES